ncbi:hypothetical protein J2X46_001974 [Nocardioides sp. BE266]|uniref:hypothetical protein n=1 Tax=Nocardioides sp. BE266 TaxID=2817725 RepID=UPI0028547F3B|nr:hypothetical protein [Nocardioides sp. BE266]MDR7252989.1 hypothetical protein [Nocardioides sp. BE266]
MSESDLLTRLDHELAHLPSVPAPTYLLQGRRARRRRRAAVGAVGVAAAAALAVSVLQVLSPGDGTDRSQIAEDGTDTTEVGRLRDVPLSADPDVVAPQPNNPVEAVDGLEGVDWFTTDDVPTWAQEYGEHGPVGVSPDGRLWVAPDATVRRVVVDPYVRGEDGVTASYAVEAQCACVADHFPDGLSWVIISTDGTGPGGGEMDQPGRETDDFELWVDDVTSQLQGRPSLAERLVRFESRTSDTLVPASPGVTIVEQGHDTGYPDSFASRGAVAEVTYAGTTWYVMAVEPPDGGVWYDAMSGDLADSLDAFVEKWHSA